MCSQEERGCPERAVDVGDCGKIYAESSFEEGTGAGYFQVNDRSVSPPESEVDSDSGATSAGTSGCRLRASVTAIRTRSSGVGGASSFDASCDAACSSEARSLTVTVTCMACELRGGGAEGSLASTSSSVGASTGSTSKSRISCFCCFCTRGVSTRGASFVSAAGLAAASRTWV